MLPLKSLKKYFVLIPIILITCQKKHDVSTATTSTTAAAIINNKEISLFQVDSLVNSQLTELRMNALEILISRYALELEATKQKISLEELVKKEIDVKAKKVTSREIEEYINKVESQYKDTESVSLHLKYLYRKERQVQYVDSLTSVYGLRVLLLPVYFNKADTAGLYSHVITGNSSVVHVYIISDFKCSACQKVEKKLEQLYLKYSARVQFRFIYFSEYVDEDALACEAAAMQGKFRQMHDMIFEHADVLTKQGIHLNLAGKLQLDTTVFKTSMQNEMNIKRILKNKDLLAANKIYSTPTFLVNNKIIDGKYAIDYLENVILEELNTQQ